MSSFSFLNRTPIFLYTLHSEGLWRLFFTTLTVRFLSLSYTHIHRRPNKKCFLASDSTPHWAKSWSSVTQMFHAGSLRLMWKHTQTKNISFRNNKAVLCYHTHKDDRTVYTEYAKKYFSHLLISALKRHRSWKDWNSMWTCKSDFDSDINFQSFVQEYFSCIIMYVISYSHIYLFCRFKKQKSRKRK
jgi:hypothetical protein